MLKRTNASCILIKNKKRIEKQLLSLTTIIIKYFYITKKAQKYKKTKTKILRFLFSKSLTSKNFKVFKYILIMHRKLQFLIAFFNLFKLNSKFKLKFVNLKKLFDN